MVASAVLVGARLAPQRAGAVSAAADAGFTTSAPRLRSSTEEALNQLGYDLLAAQRTDAAIAAFRLNTELYPKSGNAYDSLAETYLRLGQKDRARELYAKALEVQPDYPNAKAAREIVAPAPKP